MKKSYISPETFSVALNTRASILQASLPVDDEIIIDDPDQILTNEYKDKSLWDLEW